jgi:hypothetical protein
MKIPDEMQIVIDEYRNFLEPTASGDSTEDLLLDETPWQTNAIRAIVAAGKRHEVFLLLKLKEAGLLRCGGEDKCARLS